MKKIKAVITDLDDTLLSPEKEISAACVEVVEKLKEQGIVFTFITGRPKYAIMRYIEQLDVNYPVVSCNGAVIFNQHELLVKHSFKANKLRELMEKASDLGLTVLYYTDDTEYTLKETKWVKVRVDAGRHFPVRALSEQDWSTLTCEKINIMADGNTEAFSQIVDEINRLKMDFSIALYGLNGCEIVAKEVDKSVGMKELAKILGVSVDEIMAIGDNANDNKMLEQAGIGVAVGNAKEETKKYADYICNNDYTEGVIEAIQKFVLKKGE